MKKTYRAMITTLIILMVAISASAQESLEWFTDDTFLMIDVDLKTLYKVLPADVLDEWRHKGLTESGIDFMEAADFISLGFPPTIFGGATPADMYLIIRGKMDAIAVVQATRAKGKNIKEEKIGLMTAYIPEEKKGNETYYLADAGPGLLVAGTEKGLIKYQALAAGQLKSATGSPLLNAAKADVTPGSIFSLYGVVPETVKSTPQFESLETFAFHGSFANDLLSLRLVVSGSDVEALSAVEMMIKQYSQMFSQLDSSGAISELDGKMESSIGDGKLIITSSITKATIETLAKEMAPMMLGTKKEK